MKTYTNQHLILDRHEFREVMKEAKDLIQMAKRFKYDLMHEHSLDLYNMWAPYVLGDFPSSHVQAPGFKIAFVQVMSIVMAMKGEKEEKTQKPKQNFQNVINFLSYKANKNIDKIYQTTNSKG